jgi:hypothetical protein
MAEKKRKLQYITLMWEELPESVSVFVIPRSAITKADIKMLRACHLNYAGSVSHNTSAAEPLEIDRSLCRLNNIVLDPSHDWVNKMYIKSESDQLNISTDDFSEILGKWHQFKVDVEKPCTLPRSKFYKSGYLR